VIAMKNRLKNKSRCPIQSSLIVRLDNFLTAYFIQPPKKVRTLPTPAIPTDIDNKVMSISLIYLHRYMHEGMDFKSLSLVEEIQKGEATE